MSCKIVIIIILIIITSKTHNQREIENNCSIKIREFTSNNNRSTCIKCYPPFFATRLKFNITLSTVARSISNEIIRICRQRQLLTLTDFWCRRNRRSFWDKGKGKSQMGEIWWTRWPWNRQVPVTNQLISKMLPKQPFHTDIDMW